MTSPGLTSDWASGQLLTSEGVIVRIRETILDQSSSNHHTSHCHYDDDDS